MTVKCDKCGDESNSAPGLMCGRVDGGELPCTGTYREVDEGEGLYQRTPTYTYVITASVYVDDVASAEEAAEAVEELNRGGSPGNIDIRLPDPDSGFEWSLISEPEED